ncbi:hypothetical protein Poli38472_013852 [Pythium oligandrum]|uniref:AB hydrolase-1 domain-containing protein n=1 Tax=Pythium oligandrum TaxID=41045 RepID=A0A8K1C276_PYTOL|nr:hypothetical protein Poli38472_013852 [Pythium oligandrum]|eukprot:TMW55090.1 hypothetical protein Poli38472_013852 [Pythium oligandrum]
MVTTGLRLLRPLAATTGWATKGKCWQWTSASYEKLEQAERRILERAVQVPFEMTKVASLGTVIVPCSDEEKRRSGQAKDLVLIHGFAGGNAVWATNLEHLAKHFNVYAVEWIGAGRSDRPDFPHNDYDSADHAVVSAFEQWRQEMQLEQFHLCAHSMGAIFASSYAIKHPEKVNHLVLVSPAGVGHSPPVQPPATPEEEARQRSWLRKMVFSAWDSGYTPMSLARGAGPYGPKLVQNTLLRRISFMPESSALRQGSIDINDLSEYIYHNWALKASSEKTMSTHLAPMAFARRPLIDTLLPERIKMPVTFVYGGHSDWMDYRQGQKVVDQLRQGGLSADLHLVPHAGHQVFVDNPKDFNNIVVKSLTQTC